jgi:hypothetical protein
MFEANHSIGTSRSSSIVPVFALSSVLVILPDLVLFPI